MPQVTRPDRAAGRHHPGPPRAMTYDEHEGSARWPSSRERSSTGSAPATAYLAITAKCAARRRPHGPSRLHRQGVGAPPSDNRATAHRRARNDVKFITGCSMTPSAYSARWAALVAVEVTDGEGAGPGPRGGGSSVQVGDHSSEQTAPRPEGDVHRQRTQRRDRQAPGARLLRRMVACERGPSTISPCIHRGQQTRLQLRRRWRSQSEVSPPAKSCSRYPLRPPRRTSAGC